jgi:hypothetical protein
MKQLAISAFVLTAFCAPASAAVIISTGATSHVHCVQGVCTAAHKNAVLNVTQLQTLLAAGDVTVATGGAGAASIAVTAPLTWASAHRLTLNSVGSVSIKAAVVSEGTGGVTIKPNDGGGSGGDLNIYPGGSISFWDNSSSLIIAGGTYTLVSDIGTLASDVAANAYGLYALAKDYDASADGTYTDTPVKDSMGGTFEGLGHTISNLSIAATGASSDIAFFARVAGTVRDVAFAGANVNCGTQGVWSGILASVSYGAVMNVSATGTLTCTGGYGVGGLVGDNDQGSTIAHSSANVSLFGGGAVGGLAGVAVGTISFSTATPSLSASQGAYVGGLVGVEKGGTITDSHASAYDMDTATASYVGGLVGFFEGKIERCSAGNTFGIGALGAGGLAGTAYGAIIDSSFATGQVQARRAAGGLVGVVTGNMTIANSYSTTTVNKYGSGADDLGGLIGTSSGGTITSAWSSGGVANKKREVRGGFVGSIDNMTVTAGYWDLTTSGVDVRSQGAGNVANYPGIRGLKTVEFQSGLPSGFDPAIWAESPGINNGYPYLIANPPQ